MNATIETYSGLMFDLIDPKPEQISIEDIAHATSQLCRFTGHTKFFYPVAQHEWLGSYLVPEKYALKFLLHDAAEAYISDLSTPLKYMTSIGDVYKPIEHRISQVIDAKFGIVSDEHSEVEIKRADGALLLAEKNQLMAGGAQWTEEYKSKWSKIYRLDNGAAADITIEEYSPSLMKALYLSRFKQLTGQLTGE